MLLAKRGKCRGFGGRPPRADAGDQAIRRRGGPSCSSPRETGPQKPEGPSFGWTELLSSLPGLTGFPNARFRVWGPSFARRASSRSDARLQTSHLRLAPLSSVLRLPWSGGATDYSPLRSSALCSLRAGLVRQREDLCMNVGFYATYRDREASSYMRAAAGGGGCHGNHHSRSILSFW